MDPDPSNFRQIILDFPSQLGQPLEFFNQIYLKRRSFNKIILAGMGGSALGGDLFYLLKNKKYPEFRLSLPIFIHRSYGLPPDCDEQTLLICSSYSGNTEETISVFEKAKEKNIEVAGLCSGGTLAESFLRDRIPWIKIPPGLPPRCALGWQVKGLAKILVGYGLFFQSFLDQLEFLAKNLNSSEMENEARLLCPKLAQKIPTIYSSEENKALARILKIKFNENSKIPAFFNAFPELNHNEMVGWTKNFGPFIFLFLKDADDPPRVQKRMNLTAQILADLGLRSETIEIKGNDPLEKIFKNLILGDWLSYHLALFYGVDPTPVELVEELKRRMRG